VRRAPCARTIGALLAALLLLGGLCGAAERAVFRVADRATVAFGAMVKDAAAAKFLFIGELHGVEDHHRTQLAVIRALHEAGVPLAVGVEMFRAENQQDLDRWIEGSLSEGEFRRRYEDNWTLPWPLYRDIFDYCRVHRIPLAGLNVPDAITRKVARGGFSALSQDDLKKLPAGISCSVDDRYREFIRRAHGPRGLQHGQSFQNFCEAQMVWDAAMAKYLAEFSARDSARTIVTLAGTAHAWRRGIPTQLAQLLPSASSRVIMPLLVGRIEELDVTPQDADYIVL
jgi:uncharacterized iron-regulated protein